MPEKAGLEPEAGAAAIPQPGENSAKPKAALSEDESLKSYSIAPDHEAPKADALKPDTPKEDVIKGEASKAELSKAELSKGEVTKFDVSKFDAEKDQPEPATLIVMPPADRSRTRQDFRARAQAQEEQRAAGQRRISAMAVIVLACLVGAISGALATGGVMRFAASPVPKVADNSTLEVSTPAPKVADNSALEASIARIDADIVALKASLEHSAKIEAGLNKTSERLDKLEKAQAEPMARLAKLSEAVDKLRASQQAAAKEATGSTTPTPQTAAGAPTPTATAAPSKPTQTAAVAPVSPSKPEVGRLPTVEGWRLRDVGNGSALIEGRTGVYEVYAGVPVPGLGRVDAIRRQDGHWVVVTSKGLIVGH